MINNFIKYFIGEAASKSVAIISIPIYSLFLEPDQYGVYFIIIAYVGICSNIFSLNFHTSVGRFMYEKKEDISGFYSTLIIATVFILFISLFIIFLFPIYILNSIFSFDYSLYGFYFLLLIILNIFFLTYVNSLVPSKKSIEHSLIYTIKGYGTFFIVFCFIYFKSATTLSFLQGIVLSEIIIFIYILFRLLKLFKFIFNIKYLKYIFLFSIPLIPYNLSSIVLSQIDRIMIGNILGNYQVGIYSVAYVLGSLPTIFHTALNHAWLPEYFENIKKNKVNKVDKHIINIIYLMLSFIFLFILYSEIFFSVIISPQYYEGLYLIPLVGISMIYLIFWAIFSTGISYSKKTHYIAIAGVIAALSNILFNLALIPLFGLKGAVFATLLSHIIIAIFGYIFLSYKTKVHVIDFKKILIPIILSFLLIALSLINQSIIFIYIQIITFPGIIVLGYFYKLKLKLFITQGFK